MERTLELTPENTTSCEHNSQWNPSESENYPVSCPQCGQETEFTIWTILNSLENPQEAQSLAKGSLTDFTCPNCGYRTVLNHPCLYLDPIQKCMIYNVCGDAEMSEQAILTFNTLKNEEETLSDALFRIVDTHAQLSDKVAILSEGLDDKVMEVLKLSVLGHAQNQGKVTENSYCAVQFTERIDGELHFRIQADNETFLSSISEEAYQVFAEALVSKEPPLVHPYVVDLEWAYYALTEISQ